MAYSSCAELNSVFNKSFKRSLVKNIYLDKLSLNY